MSQLKMNQLQDVSVQIPQGSAPKGRVLLVEDDELTAEWVSRALAKKGIETWHVNNLASAQNILSSDYSRNVHAVVTDVYLSPNKAAEGMDVLRLAEKCGMPVVVITSQADLKIAKESVNRRACGFLEKPFKTEHLVELLTKAWTEPSYLSAILERFVENNSLTEKEAEACRYLFKGLSNREIAEVMKVTEKTVKFHVSGIFEKCQVKSRSELLSTVFPT